MNNNREWEKYYLEYINRKRLEHRPVSIEELNQVWIDMMENTVDHEENLNWIQAFSANNYPETRSMSVQELNEIYVKLYARTQNADIINIPTYSVLSAA